MAVTRRHCWGFPCSGDLLFHACRRHYPGGTVGCCRYLVQRRRPSPKTRRVGFRIFLFEACSAFTHVPACMVAKSPKVTRYTRVLQRICYLLRRSGCFRPSDRLAGWDSHPLEIDDFHGNGCDVTPSRVERWRGGLGVAYRFPALSSAGASLAAPCSVSTSRSSNRACGFLAHGSPTGFSRQHTMARSRPPVSFPASVVRGQLKIDRVLAPFDGNVQVGVATALIAVAVRMPFVPAPG